MERAVTILGWLIAAACAIAAAAFFVALFVIACRNVPGGHEGDLGTWAGAIFAGLAFGGTIWLASSSERRRREELRVRGAIALPALRGYVTNVRVLISAIADGANRWLTAPQQRQTTDFWSAVATSWQEQAFKIEMAPDNYIVDVAAISFVVPAELHATQADIRTILVYISHISRDDVATAYETAKYLADGCQHAHDNLGLISREIDRLKVVHGWPEE